MKAYLLNGVVSFSQVENAVEVQLAEDISNAISAECEYESTLDEIRNGSLEIKYFEDGKVVCYRYSDNNLVEICEGKEAEAISIYCFDELEAYSLANPFVPPYVVLARAKTLIPVEIE